MSKDELKQDVKLPSNKGDVHAAVELAFVPPELLAPHTPELLEWLQDGNWPVAAPVAAALARCGISLVEPIRKVLNSNDDIWKYWVLSRLLCQVDADVRRALEPELLRIVNEPTVGEAAESVPLAARDVIFQISYVDTES